MKIETFIKYNLNMFSGINGLIIPHNFEDGQILFNNIADEIGEFNMKEICLFNQKYSLELNNKSKLDMFLWNENMLHGYRFDFVICQTDLTKNKLNYLWPILINNNKKPKFIYCIEKDDFLYL
jgi:flagellar assembly factor FliW